MNNLLIKIDNLSKSFIQGGIKIVILKNVSVCFEQGRSYAITGVSGSGKSTFLQLLSGLDQPDDGCVCYDNRNLSSFSQYELDVLHNRKIGLLFQQPYLIKELSVIENIMLPGLISGEAVYACKKRALFLLRHVDLIQKVYEKPAALSGGQQQRAALARALFNRPLFLLADEPTGSLDEEAGYTIIDLLLSCQREWNMGLIISSHDKYIVQEMQYIYQLKNGELCKLKCFNQMFQGIEGNGKEILQQNI